MAYIKQKGDPHKYWVVNAKCIGAECLAFGLFQHRGATMSGSRNTGSPDSPMCMRNAYRGCPQCVVYSKDLAAQRRKEGLKLV
jgi:hypothetical protein